MNEILVDYLNIPDNVHRAHIAISLDFGGSESQMISLARTYKDMGLQKKILFVALTQGGFASQTISSLGFEVVILKQVAKIPSFKLIIKLVSKLREFKINQVITSGAEANFHGVIAARLLNIRNVVSEEIGISGHGFKARQLFALINRLALYNIAASPLVAKNMIGLGETTNEKVRVIYAPIYLSKHLASPKSETSTVRNFLFLGRLEKVKNVDLLIESVGKIVYHHNLKNIKLTIVGDGSEKSKLRKQIRLLDLGEHIVILPKTSQITDYLRECQYLIQASTSEGMGLALIEALEFGRPVISTKVGIAEEVIRNNVNGFLVKEVSIDSIAEEMLKALRLSREEYTKMAQASYDTNLSRYSSYSYVHEVNKLLGRNE